MCFDAVGLIVVNFVLPVYFDRLVYSTNGAMREERCAGVGRARGIGIVSRYG